MNANEKRDDFINAILKDAHNEIQPCDSWQALRARIDERVYGKDMPSVFITRRIKNAAFWRRVALAMAACLIITLAILVYILGYTGGNWQRQQIATDNQGLLSHDQLAQLSTAFSHVRQLFGQHTPWMVVDSGGDGEIGVDGQTLKIANSNKVIIVRLAVNVENQKEMRRYFDVVTFSNQQVRFRMSLTDDSDMDVSLKPMLTSDGRIEVEINAQVDSGSQAGGVVTVADNLFTSLVRVRADSNWVNIDAVARSASNI